MEGLLREKRLESEQINDEIDQLNEEFAVLQVTSLTHKVQELRGLLKEEDPCDNHFDVDST